MRTLQQRNIALCIVLSVVTCGIYALYWFVCLTDDTNTAAGVEGTSGVTGVQTCALPISLITCGIYGFYWAYKCGEKLDQGRMNRGLPAANSGVLYLILYLLGGIIAYALIQNELNRLAE